MGNFVHGKNAFASFNTHDVSDFFDKLSMPFATDKAESSTFRHTAKKFLPGMDEASISGSGLWDPAFQAYVNTIKATGLVPFVYGPAGNETGKVRFSGMFFIDSYTISTDTKGNIAFDLKGQVSDVVTIDVFA